MQFLPQISLSNPTRNALTSSVTGSFLRIPALHIRTILFVLTITFFFTDKGISQDFSDVSGTEFPTVPLGNYNGSLEWGDFDQDGDLDILTTGQSTSFTFNTTVYRYNSASQEFENFAGADNLLDLSNADASFGDYDNDGDLDILIAGQDISGDLHTKIYYYDQNTSTFREDSTASPCLLGVKNGSVDWGDYNNDGLLDIVVTGNEVATGTPILNTRVYRNEGYGVFIPTFRLGGIHFGEIEWADLDNDHYLDLIYTGSTTGSPIFRIWQNDQGEGFTFSVSLISGISNASIDIADFDSNGFLDLAVSGEQSGTRITRVYHRSNNSFAFTNPPVNLTGLSQGEVRWGDYDNDGLSDLLITGNDGSGPVTKLYKASISPVAFTEQVVTSAALTDFDAWSSAAWGDFDQDNKLDLVLCGQNSSNTPTLLLFKNNNASGNITLPPIPNALAANQSGDITTLSWSIPSSSYPSALEDGLSYQLAIGTSSGSDDLMAPMADLATGFRRIARRADANDTSWEIVGLSPGTYHFQVQSVDPDFEGSGFSSSIAFTVTGSSPVLQFEDVTGPEFGGIAPPGLDKANLSWADYDNDGDLDLLICGLACDDATVSDIRTLLYENTPTGFITVPGAAGLPDIQEADIAWADVNQDGWIDLAICGRTNTGELTRVYQNNSNGTFSPFSSIVSPLTNVSTGSVDWGDYDQDGDLDLLLTGLGSGIVSKIYKNRFIPDGIMDLVEDAAAIAGVPQVYNGDAKWGDFDGDGYPDFMITGNDGTTARGELFQNNQDGTFSNPSINISPAELGEIAWADLNNDSLMDIVMCGEFGGSNIFSVFLTNASQASGFDPKLDLPGRTGGSIALADYDDDGLVDILITGDSASGAFSFTEVYKNILVNIIKDNSATSSLRGLNAGSSVAWADFDGDGKIDLATTGLLTTEIQGQTEPGKVTKLYRNINTASNIVPNPPTNLTAVPDGFGISLNWDLPNTPAGYNAAYLDGLTYAVYVKRVGGSPDTLQRSPMADISNGFRRIAEPGKQGHTRQTTISNLSPGTYEWTVQSIDQDLEGSVFATISTFEYDNPAFVDVSSSLFPALPSFPPDSLIDAKVALGNFENGNLDIVAIGKGASGNPQTILIEYDPLNDYFVPSIGSTIANVSNGSVEWGDFDLDGQIDLLITGERSGTNGNNVCRVYFNQSGVFNTNDDVDLFTGIGLEDGIATAADYDNDGDLDILVSGTTDFNTLTQVFINNGNKTFSNSGINNLKALRESSADWGDFNNDGYLDILIAGTDGSSDSTLLYVNQQDGSFQLLSTSFTGIQQASVAWGDVNADGFLDAAIAGFSTTLGGPVTEVWINNQDETFSLFSGPYEGVFKGSVDWGDFNDDGYKDLLVTGENGNGLSTVHLYRYDLASNSFIDDVISASPLVAVKSGDAAWADLDDDGKLDLVMLGERVSGNRTFRLFQNIEDSPNTIPDAPTKLNQEVLGYEIRFSWDPPGNIANSLLPGLSYNLRVGTAPGAADVYHPHADLVSGERNIVHEGEVSDSTAFRLYNLPAGTYYWSVQAIDADFEASAFSQELSFTYVPPSFTDITATSFGAIEQGVESGAIDWGDYDADGDMDLIMVGQGISSALASIWKNNGDSTFSTIPFSSTGIAPLIQADVAWGDYDNDDLLDLIVLGETAGGQRLTRIFHNDGGDSFSDVIGLDSVSHGAAAWGDMDYDGDLDVALIGDKGSNTPISKIYRNDNGVFTDIQAGLEGVSDGDVIWLDANVDGFLDHLYSGKNATDSATLRLYLNDGNDGFDLVIDNLIPAKNSSLDVADFNLDGYPDFMLAGESNQIRAIRLFTSDAGDGTFTLQTTLLDQTGAINGIINGDASFGDFDDDGRPDVLFAGASTISRNAAVYRNIDQGGQPLFEIDTIATLPIRAVENADVAWADFNNDGKLDVAITGQQSSGVFSLRLYQNIDSTANILPPVPVLQNPVFSTDTVLFTWTAPGAGPDLSYNLYVRTPSGQIDIVNPMADTDDGYRRVARRGNVGQQLGWKLKGLNSGTYHWAVQSIGQDYEGSDFSPEGTFNYTAPLFVNNNVNFLDLPENLPGFEHGDLDWADIDGDADLDLIITGEIAENEPRTVVFRNQNGRLERDLIASNSLADLSYSSLSFADVNLDGSPDLLLTGDTTAGLSMPQTILYRNNHDGTGRFTLDPLGAKFPQLAMGASAWADYDNDGDPDVVVSGLTQFGPNTTLYLNNREDNVFTQDPFTSISPVKDGALAWGDFDQDGDPDLAVSGYDDNNVPIAQIYRNLGIRGGLEKIDMSLAPLTGVGEGSLDWGDIDNDGYLELLLTGESDGSGNVTEIYRYSPATDRFDSIPGLSLPGIKNGKAAWGDFDDDGYMDIILTGLGNTTRLTQLFRNDQSGGFVEDITTSTALTNVNEKGNLAWGDVDNDGKLDVAVMGRTLGGANPENTLIIFQNREPNANTIPDAPTGLSASSDADSVVLDWTPPSNANGYTYNVWIGTSPTDLSLKSPMSHLPGPDNGYRKLVQLGNAGSRDAYRIMGLPAGTYYWAVQSIDQDFEGSVFSSIESFTHTPPHFVDVSSAVLDENEIQGIDLSSAAWGDFDGDNDLDVLAVGENLAGEPTAFLLENINRRDLRLNATLSSEIEGVRNGDLAWHDYDRDGDLDVVIVGETSNGPSAWLYEYDGLRFVQINKGFSPLASGRVAWQDYDHDGDADLALMGLDGSGNLVSELYQQDANGSFSSVSVPLQALGGGDLAWADIDRNGKADLLMIGSDNSGTSQAYLYRNRGNGKFDQQSDFLTTDMIAGRMDVGDMDNDGYPDLLLTGTSSSGQAITQIYHNRADSSGNMDALVLSAIEDLQEGDGRWGDYNEDGYLDILLTGSDASGTPQSLIYQNLNRGTDFAIDSLAIAYLENAGTGSAMIWGDYNGDKKLDFIQTGRSTDTPLAKYLKIFRNDEPTRNVIPDPPVNLTKEVIGDALQLRWEPPVSLDSSLVAGYSYNLFIGESQGGSEVLPSLAQIQKGDFEGLYRIVRAGEGNYLTEWLINGLEQGKTYYWGVQAIDQDFEGSRFATDSIVFTPPAFDEVTDEVFPNGAPVGFTDGSLAMADYDQDGDLDVITAGETGINNPSTTVYLNQGGTFVEDEAATMEIPDLSSVSFAWGDYNNDGRPDLALSGREIDGSFTTRLYTRTESGFEYDIVASEALMPVISGALDWGDYDQDGDQDLALIGLQSTGGGISNIYENLGDGTFQRDATASDALVDVYDGDIAWGDYDANGRLDLALTGNDGTSGIAYIYSNDGNSQFSIEATLAPVLGSSLAWGDVNNIGGLSLVLTGNDPDIGPLSRLYRYNPASGFAPDSSVQLPDVYQGSVAFGDYDDNGLLDILLSGRTSINTGNSQLTKTFFNTDGQFQEDLLTSSALKDIDLGNAIWGDFDNDQKLDMLLAGRTLSSPSSVSTFAVYRNIDLNENETYTAPTQLTHQIFGPSITMRWQPPAGVAPDKEFGLSYNVSVGTLDNPASILSPLSQTIDNDGYRQVVKLGNAGHAKSMTVSGLPNGLYCWTVQVVEPDREGSVFADTLCFRFENPVPVIADSSFASQYDGNPTESWIEVQTDTLIDDVILHHRGIADKDWQTQVLTGNNLRYTFSIAEDLVDEIGVEYFFEVLGNFGFNAYTDTQRTYRYYPQGLDVNGLRFGTVIGSYNIVSVPLQLDNSAVSSIIEDDFGSYNIYQWRLWSYDAGTSTEFGFGGFNSFVLGKGYWLITKEEQTFNTGSGLAPEVHANDPHIISLKEGWNQIGNPYPYPVFWSDVVDSNSVAINQAIGDVATFSATGYQVNPVNIGTYEGAFVFADSAVSIRIPVTKNDAIGRRPKPRVYLEEVGPLDAAEWQIPLVLEAEGIEYPMGGIGMHPDAKESKDHLDGITLPRITEYLDLNFHHPEYFAPRFSRDIVPPADSYIWEFTVESNLENADIHLNWDNEKMGGGNQQLILFDVEHQKMIDMRNQISYLSFSDKEVRHFRIYYGNEAFITANIQPDFIHLGLAYPNPAIGEVYIPFTLPENDQAYQVEMSMYSLDGQLVAKPVSERMEQGFHEVQWNRLGQNGTRLPSGVYLYHLRVSAPSQESYRMVRRVMLK